MPRSDTPMLDALPDGALFELYSDPRQSHESIAAMFGISVHTVHARLRRNVSALSDAQAIRARRLHEYAISTLYEQPATIIDTAGNERIDPAAIQLLTFRERAASRMAGILDRTLADRAQVDVTHDASPLADYIARIAAAGSSIPIATAIEGEAVRLVDQGEAIESYETIEADGT